MPMSEVHAAQRTSGQLVHAAGRWIWLGGVDRLILHYSFMYADRLLGLHGTNPNLKNALQARLCVAGIVETVSVCRSTRGQNWGQPRRLRALTRTVVRDLISIYGGPRGTRTLNTP